MGAAVELVSATRDYGSRRDLAGESLAIPRGSLFGLIGPNGAGKSTCLSLITTLLRPTSGEVRVAGFDVARDAAEVRRRIGYAPEEPLVYSGLTPLELAELSATLHGMTPAAARGAAAEMVASFGLEDRERDPIATFSKGMRRKALLASALVHDPEILVLDEPLEELDVLAQATLPALLLTRVARGHTVIYSTHILEVVDSSPR